MTAHKLIILMFHDIYEQDPRESGFRHRGANRYKLTTNQFEGQLNSVSQVRSDAPVLVTDSRSSRGRTPFAITVDDGGLCFHSLIAPRLAALGWRGHCLVPSGLLGQEGFLQPHHVREIRAAGHLVGSHSATHPDRIHACSWEQLVAEWARSKAILEDILGEEVTVGSVPGGFYAPRVARAAREAGLEILLTSEPKSTAWVVEDCQVLGRFTVRRDSPPDLAGRLVGPNPAARLRQWTSWNGKKILKKFLGAGYIRLSRKYLGSKQGPPIRAAEKSEGLTRRPQ